MAAMRVSRRMQTWGILVAICAAGLVLLGPGRGVAPAGVAKAKGASVLFGFNDDWLRKKNRRRLEYPDAAGADVLRVSLAWAQVEPAQGVWNWSAYDDLYGKARERGMRLLFTAQAAPCWAHSPRFCGAEGNVPPDKAHLDEWAEFIKLAVARYPEAAALEVWNEPNLVPYWIPRPQPKQYARLLKVTYKAANSVDPKLPVLFGGSAGGNLSIKGTRLGYLFYLRRALDAGARRFFDGLAIHSYNSTEGTAEIFRKLRAELTSHHRKRVPLWLTETGFSSRAKGGEARQARRLRRHLRSLAKEPRVRALIVHRMFDVKTGPGGGFREMGLVRLNGTRKPAFCAAANAGRRRGCARG